RQVLLAHDTLRTAFLWEGLRAPVQVVLREPRMPFELVDLRDRPAAEQAAALQAFRGADRRRGFDLSSAPLMRTALVRVAERRYELVWTVHHLLLDGWSAVRVMAQVLSVYTALSRGERPELRRGPGYKSYVEWLAKQDVAARRQFWSAQLGD